MRSEKVNSAFEEAYLKYAEKECQRKKITVEAGKRFDNICRDLPEHTEEKQSYKKLIPIRIAVRSMGVVAASLVLLMVINFANPAFAESLPLVGQVFENINNAFKVVNSGTKSPVGTNVGTYETKQEQLPMEAPVQTEYKIEITETFSDGEFAHAAMKLTTPTGAADEISYFFVTGESKVDGVEANNALFGNGGITRFHETEEPDTFVGTVSVKLPENKVNGDVISLDINMEQFYLCHRDLDKDDELRKSRGFGKTGDRDIDGLEADIPAFSQKVEITVDTSNNKDFGVEAQSGDYKIYHVESTPSTTFIKADVPSVTVEREGGDEIIEVTQEGINALYTPDGKEIQRNYNLEDRQAGGQETAENWILSVAFDGVPAGTTELIFRWYTDYDYKNVIAEFTIDLTNETAEATEKYKDEKSPLYLYNPDRFIYGDGIIDGSLKYQNGLLLDSLWIKNSEEESYADIKIYSENKYKEIEYQLIKGDTVIASEKSYDGTRATDYAVKTGFYDEREKWFDGSEPYYYSFRTNIPWASISSNDSSLKVKVLDVKTGEILLEEEVKMEYQWG